MGTTTDRTGRSRTALAKRAIPDIPEIPGLAQRIRSAAERSIDRRCPRTSREPKVQSRRAQLIDRLSRLGDADIYAAAPSDLTTVLVRYPGRGAPIDEWQRFNDALAPLLTLKAINDWAATLLQPRRAA